MKYFNCFAVFCVCLLLQVEANFIQPISQDGEDISDAAKAAFDDLEKLITAVIKIARESISGVETTLNVLQETVTKLAKETINQLGNEIFAKLDELKKDIPIIGVNIIDCTEDREDDLKQLLVTYLNETGFCAVKKIDEVFDSLSDIVGDIDNANDLLKDLPQELEDCKNEQDEGACITKVLEQISEAALKVPAKITEDVNKSKKLINELENYLFECYHDNYNQLEITSMEIYNGIVQCIKEKLNPTYI